MQLLPLIPFVLWLIWLDAFPRPSGGSVASFLFLMTGILSIVSILRLWAVRVLPYSFMPNRDKPVRLFRRGEMLARLMILCWYAFVLFVFGFGDWLRSVLMWAGLMEWRVVAFLCCSIPVWIGFAGTWWASYQVDRSIRERNAGMQLELDEIQSIVMPPTLGRSLGFQCRMKILFVAAPVMMAMLIRDVMHFVCRQMNWAVSDGTDLVLMLASIAIVFVISPVILVRVLQAEPLADSPMRRRLEMFANRLGLGYRDILVWRTGNCVGNAAVMGLFPRFRYILLTDLLIESLRDREIDAVFAHEAGHVRHRHLWWYVVLTAIFVLMFEGPGTSLYLYIAHMRLMPESIVSGLITLAICTVFVLGFGMLARLFEKQADVFAARSIQMTDMQGSGSPLMMPVGSIGAERFAETLVRVAQVNDIPIKTQSGQKRVQSVLDWLFEMASNFLHPSIPQRIAHLRSLSQTTDLTERFDRKVVTVMLGLLFLMVSLASWYCVTTMFRLSQ